MEWLIWIGLFLCLLALAAVGLSLYGASQWADSVRMLNTALNTAQPPGPAVHQTGPPTPPTPTRFNLHELDGLPAPVQRYFRTALRPGQPIITTASLGMAGRFNLSPTGERWRPFTAQQHVATQRPGKRPGFVWNAQIAMIPGIQAQVVDSYIAGRGLLHAAMQGVFTVAQVRGNGDIARGEFMRYLAEMAWYPTALLPSQGVRWEAVDDHSAKATLVDGPVALTLLFRFNRVGLIESFRAEARGSMLDGQLVMAPWEGQWSNYQPHSGMTVPFTGQVAWVRPEGLRPYFVGNVTSLAYEFAQ